MKVFCFHQHETLPVWISSFSLDKLLGSPDQRPPPPFICHWDKMQECYSSALSNQTNWHSTEKASGSSTVHYAPKFVNTTNTGDSRDIYRKRL